MLAVALAGVGLGCGPTGAVDLPPDHPSPTEGRDLDRVALGQGGLVLLVEGRFYRLVGDLLERLAYCDPAEPEEGQPHVSHDGSWPYWLDERRLVTTRSRNEVCDVGERRVERVHRTASECLSGSLRIHETESGLLTGERPSLAFRGDCAVERCSRLGESEPFQAQVVCTDGRTFLADFRSRRTVALAAEGATRFPFAWDGANQILVRDGGRTSLHDVARPEAAGLPVADADVYRFSPDRRALVALSTHQLRVYDLTLGGGMERLDPEPEWPIQDLGFTPDGASFVVLYRSRALRHFPRSGHDHVDRFQANDARASALSPAAARVAFCVPSRTDRPDQLMVSRLPRVDFPTGAPREVARAESPPPSPYAQFELSDGACAAPQLQWLDDSVLWVVWGGGVDIVRLTADRAERRVVRALAVAGRLRLVEDDHVVAELDEWSDDVTRVDERSAFLWHAARTVE